MRMWCIWRPIWWRAGIHGSGDTYLRSGLWLADGFPGGQFGQFVDGLAALPPEHVSIGASTAVFGALGVLTGASVWLALLDPRRSLSLPQWLLPVLGGLTLLGLFGMGEGPIDVLAHVCGFGVGFAIGLAGAWRGLPETRSALLPSQWAGWLVPLTLAFSWCYALWLN